MSEKTKLETKVVTADGVIKAVSNGAKSLTGIAKMLGYKSGSSAILKKIIQAVPDIESRIASNKPTKDGDGKTKGKKIIADKPQAPSTQNEGEQLCPFRKGSKYSAIWLALWRHRHTGVPRKALIEEVKSADSVNGLLRLLEVIHRHGVQIIAVADGIDTRRNRTSSNLLRALAQFEHQTNDELGLKIIEPLCPRSTCSPSLNGLGIGELK